MAIEMSARIGAMIVGAAALRGADPRALIDAVGFDPATAEDPDARMALTVETALWAEAERQTGDADLGLHTAELLQPGVFDVLDYAVRTAPTLRASLERLARYNRLEHDAAEFTVRDGAGRTQVDHAFRGGVPGQELGQHRHSIEFTLSSLVVIGRQLSAAPVVPIEVAFHHPAPARAAEHERVFGVAPRFSAGVNRVAFAAADMLRPVPAADPRLWRVIERHAEALLAARPVAPQSFAARIARELSTALSEGPPTLADIAARLHVSERTLQRHLREEGLSYDALLEGYRKNLALSYLADPKIGIAEVAYLLGYSEPSAFHRAFKRWTGHTPGALRSAEGGAGLS
ncbi:MAG: AraC family transcriptional regulator [Deltaproteobacteria bacterium HGW-Deltaproteobacteria-14]|jgi:AraC-like DNA-binding protein|nr:MAG: AraC family transcriptional regulator [Deltaproteobacteria bacterium HGW-Deltaproteobacteria-14]